MRSCKIVERKRGKSKGRCDKCHQVKKVKTMAIFKGKMLCPSCKPHIIHAGIRGKIREKYLWAKKSYLGLGKNNLLK